MANQAAIIFVFIAVFLGGTSIGILIGSKVTDTRETEVRISNKEVFTHTTGNSRGDTFIVVVHGDTLQNMVHDGSKWNDVK